MGEEETTLILVTRTEFIHWFLGHRFRSRKSPHPIHRHSKVVHDGWGIGRNVASLSKHLSLAGTRT